MAGKGEENEQANGGEEREEEHNGINGWGGGIAGRNIGQYPAFFQKKVKSVLGEAVFGGFFA